MLQLDPVSAVAPSADLVAWSRLGAAYHPDDLKAAIASQSVIELRAFLRPAEDFALYRADMAAWPGAGELRDWQVFIRDWVAANDRLQARHPGPARRRRPAPVPGTARHVRAAVAVHRLDQQQERHQAA